jgi:hypothetical protein
MKPAIGKDAPGASRRDDMSVRTGLGADAIQQSLIENLHCLQGRLPQHATRNDWYMALAYAVRDRMMDRYIRTMNTIAGESPAGKVVAYLSAEFLMGPHLGNSLINLGIRMASRSIAPIGVPTRIRWSFRCRASASASYFTACSTPIGKR